MTESFGNLTRISFIILLVFPLVLFDCNRPREFKSEPELQQDPSVVVRRRADGTLSSVNQVDEMNRVHGIRVTYYADGKTPYTRTSFEHGIKNGFHERYYRNGQVFEHTSFRNGKRDGLTRKYYMNGSLMAEFSALGGRLLPGLKEYARDGNLITDYPVIRFLEKNHLRERSRLDLHIFSEPRIYPVDYYRTEPGTEHSERVPLVSERGEAVLQFYVKPGEVLDEQVEITAEIPTELGNTLVTYHTYHLRVIH